MKALVGTFNQEKALVGAFSVIVQPVVEPMDRFAALVFMIIFGLSIIVLIRIIVNIFLRLLSVKFGQFLC